MHRPLWQIFLCLLLLAFVLRRTAVAFLVRAEGLDPALVAVYALQMAAGAAAVAGLWWARPWAIGAVIALGIAVGASVLLETFYLGLVPPLAALAQLLLVALATGGLALILRYELGRSGSARGSEGHDP